MSSKVKLLTVRDGLLTVLECLDGLWGPYELAVALIRFPWNQFPQRYGHLGHVRYMITEVAGESNELQKVLLSLG